MKKFLLLIGLIGFVFLFKVDQAKAQTGCAYTPPTNTGRVTLSTTTTAGTYRVWSRVKAPDTTNNSFYVQIDSNCAILVGNSSSIPANTWTWVDYKDGTSTSKIDVTVTAGDHVITIIGNEPGVGVDKLLMTKNLTCVPADMSGSNCPAEVIATPTPGTPDTTKPVISAISAINIYPTYTDITWNLNEPATGQVKYGLTSSYGSLTTKETSFSYTAHVQRISGLTAGTTYHYQVISGDQAGNIATSNDCTFITPTSGTTAKIDCISTSPTTPTPSPTPTVTPTKAPTVTPTPGITLIPSITPTTNPTATILKFLSVKLHGIGSGGDNTNPTSAGNPSPVVTTRTLNVELVGSSTTTYPAASGNITFDVVDGDFAGSITLDPSIPSGSYIVKVKSPQYLRKQLTGILTITKGSVNSMPNVSLTTGDINNDNAITISDYNILIGCYSDLLPAKNCDTAKKAASDLSSDNNVNADDYNLFLRELSVVTGE
jgi:hypothetical protein